MFRLCWEKYIIDKKINGYYLWERVAPFKYEERVSGEDSLVDFFVEDDVENIAEHILSENQAQSIYIEYEGHYKSHITRTVGSSKQENLSFDYGTYEDFISEFTKIQLGPGWERKIEYPDSFFRHDENSSVHASLIKFNNIYMIMKTLRDYIKFNEFLKENKMHVDDNTFKTNKWS